MRKSVGVSSFYVLKSIIVHGVYYEGEGVTNV